MWYPLGRVFGRLPKLPWKLQYAEATLGVSLVTAVFTLFPGYLRENVDTLYILVVVATGTRSGLGPALWASLLSFGCWNFILAPSAAGSFQQLNALVSLGVFLGVAILTGQVTAGARQRTLEAREREDETTALYELSLAVTSEASVEAVLGLLAGRVTQVERVSGCFFWQVGGEGEWRLRGGTGLTLSMQQTLSGLLPQFEAEDAVRAEAMPLPGYSGPARMLHIPLYTDRQSYGRMLIEVDTLREGFSTSERRLFLAAANHAAVALQREKLTHTALDALAILEEERLKHSLLSSVSHDLRTPLASIKVAATSLNSDDIALDERTRADLVDSIVKNSDRLNALVGNLLDISRLEAGAWHPLREPYPIGEIVGTVLGRLSTDEAERVTLEMEEELPLSPIDEVQIGQVLWNLFENALKYSEPETALHLKVQERDGFLELSLQDHGCGIPEGAEEQIFQKFYRAPGHQEGGPPGMGIGLAICKAMVEAHGGTISAANTGDGAVFTFKLPVC